MRVGVSPGLVDGLGATWHGYRLERPEALIVAVVGQQKFAAPEGAVVAESETVEGDAQHRRRVEADAVLGHAAGNVSVMVLHLFDRQTILCRPIPGKLGR